MSTVVVEYAVRRDCAEENRKLVEQVVTALEEVRPPGVRYAAFQVDEVTFIHVADVADGAGPLTSIPEFQEFQRGLAERCVRPPTFRTAGLVGAYRLPLGGS